MLVCRIISNGTWFRTCFFTVLMFHTKIPHRYPHLESFLSKGKVDYSFWEKLSQRQNQARTHRALLPAASCVPHCYLMRPNCFVITSADPAWSQQLPSAQEGKGITHLLKCQGNTSLSCKQPKLTQRSRDGLKQHSGQTQQEGPESRASRQANGEHLAA